MTRLPPFREIAESTYDWEMWVDDDGIVRWVNRAVERFLTITVAECLAIEGFPMPFVVDEDRELVTSYFASARRGETGNDLEFRIRGRRHDAEWVSLSYQPLVDGSGASRGFRTSIRDIELRKENERLIAEAERDAERRAAERTELLASLSHELRTPLHCIAGFSELLLEGPLDDRSRRFLSLVADQSSGALRLVEDLLHFAAGPMRERSLRAQVVDLDALVEAQIDSLIGRAKRGVELRLDRRLGAFRDRLGDADRIRQIVANLVSNALRFTDEGAVIVSLDETEDSDRIRLEVADSGVGMDVDVLAKARQAFYRGGESAQTSRGGIGLGLAIVEQLAASHGGELVLESALGAGTRATVILRLPRATTEGGLDVVAPIGRVTREIDVLVVDDVEASRELILAMVSSVGLSARSARSGAEAIARVAERTPDLALIDYHMPGMDGVQTAEAIAERCPDGRPTIAILTANVLASAPSHAIDRWLTKPLRRVDLVRLADSVVPRDRAAPDPELDPEVLAELGAEIAGGRSLLAMKGRALLEALDEGVSRVIAAVDEGAVRAAAHTARGLAAMLGARALERACAHLEGDTSDLEARAAVERLRAPTHAALEARIAAAESARASA